MSNSKLDATFHPTRVRTGQDPEALGKLQCTINAQKGNTMSDKAKAIDAEERAMLGVNTSRVRSNDDYSITNKPVKMKTQLSLLGKIITTSVFLAIIIPFIIVLWKWVLGL